MRQTVETDLEKLNQQYRITAKYSEDDWNFFLNVADYVKLIKGNPAINGHLSELQDIKYDQPELEKYKLHALQELKKLRETILVRVKKIDLKVLRQKIAELKKYQDADPEGMYLVMSGIVSALEHSGHSELIEDIYSIETETPTVRFRTLSKSYSLYLDEKKRVDGIARAELDHGFGNAWNNLEIIYFLIYESDSYFKKKVLNKPNVISNTTEYVVLMDEIKKIQNGSPGYHFKREKFKQYLLKVHSCLVSKLMPNSLQRSGTDNEGDALVIHLGKQKLEINRNTGVVQLNNFRNKLNPGSQEFKILIKLMESKDHKATYGELLGSDPTKSNKRNLSFTVRNVKKALGILPKENSKNKDIVMNIRKHGYSLNFKLITK